MYKELLRTILDLRRYIKYILWIMFAVYLLSGIYTISQNEVGVLLRFGRIIDPKVGPGVNYHFPYPFERIIKAPIQRINTMVIDDFSDSYEMGSTPRKFYDLTGLASYCITGDNNIVGISLSIQYKIGDPGNYYFMQTSPERIIYEIASNSIIKMMSRHDVDSILTFGKRGLGDTIRDLIQKSLNAIESGVDIYFVDINYIRPPESVQSYFDDVINARIHSKNMIDEALSYKNTELLRASGESSAITESARAYRTNVINQHTGDTVRFRKRREGFSGKRDIVIRDTFLEYMSGILKSVKNMYLLDPGKDSDTAKLRFILTED